MTIQLFPCGHVPCPCPECESFLDILHPAPSRTVVYQANPGATDLSGTVTWDGGSAALIEVPAGSTLCVGGLSYDGPLLYCSTVPYAAELETLSVTLTPSSGPPPIDFTLDVVSTCTDPLTEIGREIVLAVCDVAPSVIDTGDDCPPCCAEGQWWRLSNGNWQAGAALFNMGGDVLKTDLNQNNCFSSGCVTCCTPGYGITRSARSAFNYNFEGALDAAGYSSAQKLAFYNASFSEVPSVSVTLTTGGTTATVSLISTISKSAGTYNVSWVSGPAYIASLGGTLCDIHAQHSGSAPWSPAFRMPDGCGKIVLAVRWTASITKDMIGGSCRFSYNGQAAASIGFQK